MALPTQDFIASLAERFPEDADDLNEALEDLQKQKLGTCERLARLNDGQWQRLGLPLGIESLIRDELAALMAPPAPAPPRAPIAKPGPRRAAPPAAPVRRPPSSPEYSDDDDGQIPLEPYVPPAGLRKRGGDSRESVSGSLRKVPEKKGLIDPLELHPPSDLENLWRNLLEDTLPPDKRPSLQATWDMAEDDHEKYMLYLEYSSYLRKPELTEEEKAERRKQLEPLMAELGVRDPFEEESQGAILWWLLTGFIMFVGGLVYYAYSSPASSHDMTAL